MIRVALNGFGRIGRTFLRAWCITPAAQKFIQLTAINVGPASTKDLVYAVRYDSIMGTLNLDVQFADGMLTIGDHKIVVLTQPDPDKLAWRELGIDWVVDASGRFTHRADAQKHLDAGAHNVLITAPATDEDCTVIPGVNDASYSAKHHIVSLGSCTTNAVIPVLAVIKSLVAIEQVSLTTIHAYTNTQVLLDVEAKSTRLSRAAALNIIPSSTGATRVVGKVMPELAEKIIGNSVRVPVAKVSLIDLVVTVQKNLSVADLNGAFERAQLGTLKNILSITYEPLVSGDFAGNAHSVIIDGLLTQVQGRCAKIFGWYDNEWGYSVRLIDFLTKVK